MAIFPFTSRAQKTRPSRICSENLPCAYQFLFFQRRNRPPKETLLILSNWLPLLSSGFPKISSCPPFTTFSRLAIFLSQSEFCNHLDLPSCLAISPGIPSLLSSSLPSPFTLKNRVQRRGEYNHLPPITYRSYLSLTSQARNAPPSPSSPY